MVAREVREEDYISTKPINNVKQRLKDAKQHWIKKNETHTDIRSV